MILEYITAISAAVLAAMWLIASRVAFEKKQNWLPLFLLGIILFVETLTARGDGIPWAVRVARDIASGVVLVLIVMPNFRKRGKNNGN